MRLLSRYPDKKLSNKHSHAQLALKLCGMTDEMLQTITPEWIVRMHSGLTVDDAATLLQSARRNRFHD